MGPNPLTYFPGKWPTTEMISTGGVAFRGMLQSSDAVAVHFRVAPNNESRYQSKSLQGSHEEHCS